LRSLFVSCQSCQIFTFIYYSFEILNNNLSILNMATAINFRAYLETVLLIAARISTEITNVQGYDTIGSFSSATESNVTDLVRNIRKTLVSDTVPDVYHKIPSRKAVILQNLRIYSRYIVIINRAHDDTLGTTANLDRISLHYSRMGNQDDDFRFIPAHPAKYDDRDSDAMLVRMDQWLDTARGRGGTILRYVVRENVIPPAIGDPGFLNPSIEDECIRRTLHGDDNYAANNKEVWSMVFHVTQGTNAWDLVRTYNRRQNGREAFLVLVSHFRGQGQTDQRRATAERVLAQSYYDGKRNLAFQDFTARISGAFDTLADCGDDRVQSHRVTNLMGMIRPEAGLNAAKTNIRANPLVRNSMRLTIDYLTTENTHVQGQRGTATRQRNLSEMSGRARGRHGGYGRGGGRGRGRQGRGYQGRGYQGRARGHGGGRGRGRSGRIGTDQWSEDGTTILNNGGYSNQVYNTFTANDRRIIEQQRSETDRTRTRDLAELTAYRARDSNYREGPPPPPPPPATGTAGSGLRR
jgi:hypothetical protein